MYDKHMNIRFTILEMYISMMPVILAGVLNMIWCKSDLARCLKIPMDRNIILRDGKRLFGDNKTWKGFFGMIVSGIIATTFKCVTPAFFNLFKEHNPQPVLPRIYESSCFSSSSTSH